MFTSNVKNINFSIKNRCTNCVESIFKKHSALCYKCSRMLTKDDYRPQIFEDISVEREIMVRNEISRM